MTREVDNMKTYMLIYTRICHSRYATSGFTRYIKAANIAEVLKSRPYIETIDFGHGYEVEYELTEVKLDE